MVGGGGFAHVVGWGDVARTSIRKRLVGLQLKDFLVYFYFCNKMQ